MKKKRLIFTPLLILASTVALGLAAGVVVITVAIIVALVGGTVNGLPSWLSFMVPNSSQLNDFFTGLAVLVTILLAALGGVAVFIKFAWDHSGWNTTSLSLRDDESPLRKITLDELRERPSQQGGLVNWIDRGATKPGDLRVYNRIVITGRMKLGKTREAIELIRRAVADDQVNADRIFEPSPTFRFFNRQKLLDALKGMDPYAPILLFLDDFTFHYSGENLERLSDLLSALRVCKSVLIVATARLDQLTDEHNRWLKNQECHEIRIPDLNDEQTARLLDAATGIFSLQIDDPARTAFLENRDGTPELTIMALRRLHLQDISQVNIEIANKIVSESLAESWAEARQYILKKYPVAEYILDAVATFYTAHITPFAPIVLAYANHLWSRNKPQHFMRHDLTLKRTLLYLQNFDIVVRNQVIAAPDIISEGYLSQNDAEKTLATFLLMHRRLFQTRFSRRFYRQAYFHAWCLFDLGLAANKKENVLYTISIYNASLCFYPHCHTYNNRGGSYANLKDYPAALADFNKAIELQPDNATVYYNRGGIYADLNDYDTAIADYTKAIQLQLDNAAAYNNRGNSYAALDDYPAALADFTKAIELQPDEATYYLNRGNSYADLEDHRTALGDFTTAIQLNPDYFKAYFNRGKSYGALEDYPAALADFTKAIELQPDSASAYNNRGSSYAALENYPAALADYTKAIQLQSDNALAYNNRGSSYANLEDYHSALADFTKAIQLQPDNASAYNSRGNSYAALEDYSAALMDYTKTIQLQPDNVSAYNNRGNIYSILEDYHVALADFTKAIELQPNNASAYYNRGITYTNSNDYATALADFTKTIELEPDDANAYFNRGVSYSNLNDYSAALGDFAKAIELQPGDGAAYYNRGVSYANLENYLSALADFTKAIELQHNDAATYFNRGHCYADLENHLAALADFTKAIELQPNDASAYLNRGNSYAVLKDYLAALADFTKTIELDPNDVSAYYNTARLYALQSQPILACTWLCHSILLSFESLENAKADTDFDPIRDTPEFQALLSEFSDI